MNPGHRVTRKVLSDGSREDTRRLPPNHKWTVDQRLTLSILRENYNNSWMDLTAVFNHCHKSDLGRRRLRSIVLDTQYRDMKRKKIDASAAFAQAQASLSPYERSSQVTRLELEKKANEIGINLISKESIKRKRVDSANDDLTFPPKTPTKPQAKNQINGILTPPSSKRRKVQTFTVDKKLAQIGFRAFTTQSQGSFTSALGIRAGAFRSSPTIPLAQDLTEPKYRAEVL